MEESQGPSKGQRMDADQPIERRDQDLLGRRSFAEAIARDLSSVSADKGFTAAVVGEWGTGKTSVLNMVEEFLRCESPNTAVVRFNPWLFGGAHDLLIRFFSEIGAQLGQSGKVSIKAVVGSLFELGAAAAPLSSVPASSNLATLLRVIARRLGRPQRLLDRRTRLNETLARLDRKIVVVIDDIDRLEADETRELIRLVRLTSDLPNLMFLLAFDWSQVAASLGKSEEDGSNYLDKIVQIKYDLPEVRKAVLRDAFLFAVNEAIGKHNALPLDRTVWSRVFFEVITPVLSNLRDVRRYVNSLSVALKTVGSEVALADLLGLEAVRVLRPNLFELLRSNARLLVHPVSFSAPLIREEERKAKITLMVEAEEDSKVLLNSVLEILFPATQGFLGGMNYGLGWDATWRKERRVACEEVLQIYLQAGLDEGALEHRQVEELAAALSDERELGKLLDALGETQLEEALTRLGAYEQEFPAEAVPVAVPVLINRMKKLSRFSRGVSFAPRFSVQRVVLRLMRRIDDPDRLMEIMRTVLPKLDDLSGKLHLIELVGHRQNAGLKLLSEQQAEELEKQLLYQLLTATTEELSREWDLTPLVLRFSRFMDEEDKKKVFAKVQEHLRDDNFLLAFLLSATGEIIGAGYAQTTLPWDSMVEDLGEMLTEAVSRLANSSLYRELGEEAQQVVDLAQSYAQGWRPRSIGDT